MVNSSIGTRLVVICSPKKLSIGGNVEQLDWILEKKHKKRHILSRFLKEALVFCIHPASRAYLSNASAHAVIFPAFFKDRVVMSGMAVERDIAVPMPRINSQTQERIKNN